LPGTPACRDHNQENHAVNAIIYKICTAAEWRLAEREGRFAGSAVDVADGFIHFSTASQVRETARRHFADISDLVLIGVDPARLGAHLRWERSRHDDLFPHLYGPLPLSAVVSRDPLPRDGDGGHLFPSDL